MMPKGKRIVLQSISSFANSPLHQTFPGDNNTIVSMHEHIISTVIFLHDNCRGSIPRQLALYLASLDFKRWIISRVQIQMIHPMHFMYLCLLLQELEESFNYGLFFPPSNGKAGKFLDEERRLSEYPFPGPIGYLEVR